MNESMRQEVADIIADVQRDLEAEKALIAEGSDARRRQDWVEEMEEDLVVLQAGEDEAAIAELIDSYGAMFDGEAR